MTREQKQYILGAKLVAYGLLSWAFLYLTLYKNKGLLFILLTIVSLLIWGILVALNSFLVEKKSILYLSFALSLLSFFIFFRGTEIGLGEIRLGFYYFVVILAVFFALILYRRGVIYEKETKTKINFFWCFKKRLALVFTLICFLIVLAYYFSPFLLTNNTHTEIKLPQKMFNILLKPLTGLIESRLPLYRPEMTVDEMLTMFSLSETGLLTLEESPEIYRIIQSKGLSITTADLDKLLEDPEINNLIYEEIKERTKKLSQTERLKQRKEYSEKLGIDIEGNETLNVLLYKLANSQLNNISTKYKRYIPITLAVGLFFVLRLLSLFLVPLIALISWLIIKALILVKFVRVSVKKIDMECIEL